MSGKACLTCKYVKFIHPADWKPSYSGQEYARHEVVRVIRETDHHVKAQCTFNPEWIEVWTSHYCGRWDGPIYEETVQDVIWGSRLQRQNDELHDAVENLRARLKKVQSISASRLARLRSKNADTT